MRSKSWRPASERERLPAFFQILREQLPAEDLQRLRREIPDRLEGESHFHLRLDKQAAYKGLLRLTDSKDALDIYISSRPIPPGASRP